MEAEQLRCDVATEQQWSLGSLIAAMVAIAIHSFENNANFWALTGFVQLTVKLMV